MIKRRDDEEEEGGGFFGAVVDLFLGIFTSAFGD